MTHKYEYCVTCLGHINSETNKSSVIAMDVAIRAKFQGYDWVFEIMSFYVCLHSVSICSNT